MKTFIIALLTASLLGTIGVHPVATDDVARPPVLPPYGTLCEDANVYGMPEGAEILYTLPAGEVVQLREQPRFEHRDWVMIKPARWIALSTVCDW